MQGIKILYEKKECLYTLNLNHSLWLLNMYYHLIIGHTTCSQLSGKVWNSFIRIRCTYRVRRSCFLSSSSERNLFSANQSSDKLSNSASQSERGKLKKAAFNLCLVSYTCITLYLARRYTRIIVSRLYLLLGRKLFSFSVAWGKISTSNPERFLSASRIVRLLFDESEQLERFEARDSG